MTFIKKLGFAVWIVTASVYRSVPSLAASDIIFPTNPTWPNYAQVEVISIDPDPLFPGQPTRVCARVVNSDPNNSHTATLQFGATQLGMGLPFDPVGSVEVVVPAGVPARGCVVWVPSLGGVWGIEVQLSQDNAPILTTQRNLDSEEPLKPGIPQALFPLTVLVPDVSRVHYTVSADGTEFTAVVAGDGRSLPTTDVVVNWLQAIEKK